MTTALADPATVGADRGRARRELATVAMVWRREVLRFVRSRARLVSLLAGPLLFLLVFGVGLEPLVDRRGPEGFDYQEFILPGVIGMSVLFASVTSAVSIVYDREFGFLREMLVAPVSRTAIVLGKTLGGASVALLQGCIVMAVGVVTSVRASVVDIVELVAVMVVLATVFTAFGIVVATRMRRMESFQVVMSLVVNPLFFLSGAIYPVEGLTGYMAVLTKVNPVTYGIDAMRQTLTSAGVDGAGVRWGDWQVPLAAEVAGLALLAAVLLALAARRFSVAD